MCFMWICFQAFEAALKALPASLNVLGNTTLLTEVIAVMF